MKIYPIHYIKFILNSPTGMSLVQKVVYLIFIMIVWMYMFLPILVYPIFTSRPLVNFLVNKFMKENLVKLWQLLLQVECESSIGRRNAIFVYFGDELFEKKVLRCMKSFMAGSIRQLLP